MQETNKYLQLGTKQILMISVFLTFQVAEFEELSKTESELSFKLKQAQLVVQQVCQFFVYCTFSVGSHGAHGWSLDLLGSFASLGWLAKFIWWFAWQHAKIC